MEDALALAFAFVIGMFVSLIIGVVIILLSPDVNDNDFRDAVCEYKGGQIYDKLCIVNDRIFEIERNDHE